MTPHRPHIAPLLVTALGLLIGACEPGLAPNAGPDLSTAPSVVAANTATITAAFSTPPIADGSVTDANFDGAGESILDGLNSVVVGFNALGPGEHRGIYEFDVSSIPAGATVVSATLGLNAVGTRFVAGTDPNLTLYAGAGNGFLDVSDFAGGTLVLGFLANVTAASFDNVLDVRATMQELLNAEAHFIVFVIRPNPQASGGSGAILYSSNEIGPVDPSGQFGPAELRVDYALFRSVTIDIKPGDDPNAINPKSKGIIPVAILTSGAFDATTVDPTTVHFGAVGTEAAMVQFALEDVDGDSDTDMILHFKTQDTGIVCGDTSAALKGKTITGQAIGGSNSIKTVGCQ